MSAGHPFLEVLGEIQFSAHVSFGRIWFLAVAEQESQFSGWQSAEGHSRLLELPARLLVLTGSKPALLTPRPLA